LTDEKPVDPSDISPVTIEEEMRRSYLDYAMSVIVARALPDARDGLKPVHRRILFTMKEGGYDWNRAFRKSARIVGDVMGKYHPHGDAAIYDAMVRMAQPFSMRLALVEGQGNFGSMDGDPAAAMRYTEARLARVSTALLDDIDKDTVDFQPNYDESQQEPTVLPARFPNLLVNGAGGIAVGMATNIPPHNLGEVAAATIALVENPAISIDELIALLPGPDFPTGGLILGRAGIREAYHTGRGSVVVRGRSHVEEIRKEREAIVVTEIPFQVNKARMIERIAETVREKIIEGISDIRDESDREGVRVVIELKRDAMAEIVLNQLYRHTPLQSSFGVNMLALSAGRPVLMNLKSVLEAFVSFREEVITRRTVHDLIKTRERAHVLVGLAIAVANIDAVIELIRKAPDPNVAREQLMARAWPAGDVAPLVALIDEPGHVVAEDGTYLLSDAQARAILDLRLQRLTGLERDKIAGELEELSRNIKDLLDILASRPRRLDILRSELKEIADQYGDPRRTAIEEIEFEQDAESLIQREGMVVTVTHGGYIKRVPLTAYRAQRRGGKGRAGMATRDEDFVGKIFVADTHTPVLFFSTAGMVYKMKVYRLPQGTPQARGRALINLLPLKDGETISTVMPLPEDEASWDSMFVMFATTSGNIRRNKLSDFTNVMANGKIAMKLDEGEQLIEVKVCREDQDVLLAARLGKCIRFPVPEVRVFTGRTSTGVRGIKLADKDSVISMSILDHFEVDTAERENYLRMASARRRAGEEGESEAEVGELLTPDRFDAMASREEFILTVTAKGYGKRSSSYEYRVTGRGGTGIANIESSKRNGDVVASFPVSETDQVMLVTDAGQLIRCPVDDVRIAGRKTQGVVIFRVEEAEEVVSVAHLPDLGEAAAPDAGPDAGDDGATGDITDGDITDGGTDDTGGTPENPASK